MGKGDCHHPPGLAKPSIAKSSLHCLSTISPMAVVKDFPGHLSGGSTTQSFQGKGCPHPKSLQLKGKKSDPTFSTAAKCFSSLAASPAAATPAHEVEEEI